MLTNKLQTIWLELLDVNKQNKLQAIWLELLDGNKQTTNYMARTTRC